nr:unnamed protein product [Callosobruchus analis]
MDVLQTISNIRKQKSSAVQESRNNDNRATVLSDIKLRLASDNVDTPLAPTLVVWGGIRSVPATLQARVAQRKKT